MPYATKQDMIDRFGEPELIQITDRENLGVFDEETFAQAQLDGDAEIDVYLQSACTLPLVTVPPVLVRVACDLYRYYLYGNLVPDHVVKRYDAAVKFLLRVSKGEISLGLGNNDKPVPTLAKVRVSAPDRIFSDDKLKGF